MNFSQVLLLDQLGIILTEKYIRSICTGNLAPAQINSLLSGMVLLIYFLTDHVSALCSLAIISREQNDGWKTCET